MFVLFVQFVTVTLESVRHQLASATTTTISTSGGHNEMFRSWNTNHFVIISGMMWFWSIWWSLKCCPSPSGCVLLQHVRVDRKRMAPRLTLMLLDPRLGHYLCKWDASHPFSIELGNNRLQWGGDEDSGWGWRLLTRSLSHIYRDSWLITRYQEKPENSENNQKVNNIT